MSRVVWAVALAGLALVLARSAAAGPTVREESPEAIRAFFVHEGKHVVTFLGYSGAGYENRAAMLEEATRVLARLDPARTIVNIGATAEGIGAVYDLAKRRKFLTTGIVSSQAKKEKVALSPHVAVVFYVRDATWGGFLPGTRELSPTSRAMVESSDSIVAIGGGEVARDELMAAKRAGKPVRYVPADMSHRLALEKATRKKQQPPTDFRGAAATALTTEGAPTP